MTNPLIIAILRYLREQNTSCSLIDLVNLCQHDLLALIPNNIEPQLVIFQKNFFVMNALYQIQRDMQEQGYTLSISALAISLHSGAVKAKTALSMRDNDLANYYLDWSNLSDITTEEIDALFSRFWQGYSALAKVEEALKTLGLAYNVEWFEVRQAYQKKIFVNHPDRGGCADAFIDIRTAYEILKHYFHSRL
ncbi:DNA-J related domain-containing protein [Colwellia ponticola]|uniref:J domain-containing protein n=1 Tax=Colwellia ponticola TaxID=2304625 RepID=A0A8H2PL82_9GAMM|nr:DNA-J related domain-containing protein [Colwellia ponticola]TMM46459.1 hypothetical protein FCS21_05740 [Colwellia ponticola]